MWGTRARPGRASRQAPLALVACALAACGGGGGAPVVGGGATGDTLLAVADIGPAGGTLSVPLAPGSTSPAPIELELSVPAGAVDVQTTFRALLDVDSDTVPSVFPVYRIESSAGSFDATLSLRIRAGDLLFDLGVPTLALFRREGPAGDWHPVAGSNTNAGDRTVGAAIDQLGEFVALDGNLHRLFTQPFGPIDPSVPQLTASLNGVEVLGGQDGAFRMVGRGSLSSFWNSPASQNVLILHGVLGSPLDFLGPEDLVESLGLIADNVVLLSYPSARGVRAAANELYDLIEANRQPGFGCSIVGHSMGGLVARYMLEASAFDPERPGFVPGDLPQTDVVEELILLGVPNAGAESIAAAFLPFAEALGPDEQFFVQSFYDLDERPGALPLQLNASFVDNPTRYHVVYGDIGDGSDGVVDVASALAVPLTAPETAMMFPASHDDLHLRATSLGIAVWIGELLQGS